MLHAHRILILLLSVSLLLSSGEQARAGTYAVTSCADAPGAVNNAWQWSASGPAGQLEYGVGCGQAPGLEYSGIWARERFDPPDSDTSTTGAWSFTSPSATAVAGITYSRHLRTFADDNWRVALLAGTTELEACQLPPAVETCERGAAGGQSVSFTGLSSPLVELRITCTAVCIHGSTLHSAIAVLYGSTVTISDPTPPAIGSLTGTLVSGGWLRGTRTASVTANDSTGIDTLVLRRDGSATVATDDRPCDYTRPAPCANPGLGVDASWGAIDTSSWPDGDHLVRAVARDAGNNTTDSSEVLVRTDNTAPAAPSELAIDTGSEWSSSSARALSWVLPGGQAAPINGATVRLCPPGGGACSDVSAEALTGTHLSLGSGEGEYSGLVFLADEAGNTAVANALPFTLRYDATAPPVPTLGTPEPTAPDRVLVSVSPNDPGPAPLAPASAELCRPDATDCRPVATNRSDAVEVVFPAPGEWTLRVRAIDAAGNSSGLATKTLTYRPPAPTATVQPTPTPAGQTPRVVTRLRFLSVRRSGSRLRVVASVPRSVTGRFQLRYRVRIGGHPVTVIRRGLRARGGRVTATLRLSARVRRSRSGRLELRFGGDPSHLPARIARSVPGR